MEQEQTRTHLTDDKFRAAARKIECADRESYEYEHGTNSAHDGYGFQIKCRLKEGNELIAKYVKEYIQRFSCVLSIERNEFDYFVRSRKTDSNFPSNCCLYA